jgi:hypothetical protein
LQLETQLAEGVSCNNTFACIFLEWTLLMATLSTNMQVCFIGPDIGPLKAIIVGPEQGAWQLDEVVVSSSAGSHTQRFMCREHLGRKNGKGAAVLKVVPDGKVVYGSGDSATLISVVRATSPLNSLSSRAAFKISCDILGFVDLKS